MKYLILTMATAGLYAMYQFVRDAIKSNEMDDVEFQTRYDSDWKTKTLSNR